MPSHRTAAAPIAALPHQNQPATPTGRRRHALRSLAHAVGAAARKELLPRPPPRAPNSLAEALSGCEADV